MKTSRGEKPKHVRTPTVLQMEAVECGAASLASVLAHHGRWVPLEELRLACGVSRDGSKASNILRAARGYGLVAKGYKSEPGALRRFSSPMILHWNFNHFVVFEGFEGDDAYINDPAFGPRQITAKELDDSFTGVFMTFEPGEAFEPQGSPPSLLRALHSRISKSYVALLFVILTGVALVIPGLAGPALTKVFVDRVLLDGYSGWLGPILIGLGLSASFLGALTWLQQTYLLRLETKISLSGSGRFLWHVLRLPSEFFSQRFAGDLSLRVAINDRVAQLLSRDLATNFLDTLLIIIFAGVLLRFDVLLTVITITITLLNVIALRYVSRKRVDGSRRLLQERGKLSGTAVAGLQTIESLKAMGGESDLFSRWAGYHAKVINTGQDLDRYTHTLNAVPPMLMAINAALVLGIGSLRVMNGHLSLGGLVAFQALMVSFVAPINRLVALASQLQLVEGDMNRLDDVLRYPVAVEEPGEVESISDDSPIKLAGRLELENLSFGYSRLDPPLLEGLDLQVDPGRWVALVGGSGSGKSTVARLVSGLYEPWDGEIRLDDVPRGNISRERIASSLATVDQSIFLFEGTIRENLTLWDSSIPLPEVVAAARDAEIHDDIAARPGGYDGPVEEDGANFSGGQRQRLEIARALVARPTLLVLDEATSALDPTTEKLIGSNLRRRGCTCLVIAHRLSTIRDADEIIVLDAGKVVQRGKHRDLKLEADGLYADLIAAH